MSTVPNSSLAWSEEFCRYCFIWFMFIAFSYSIRLKSDLRVDGVVNLLPKRARWVVDLIGLLVGLAVTLLMLANSFPVVSYIAKTGDYSPGLRLPMKYVYAATVGGFGLGVIRYIQRIVLEINAKRKPVELKEASSLREEPA